MYLMAKCLPEWTNVLAENDVNITIVVPVGPDPRYLNFLDECINSIAAQMIPGDELLIVDDMAFLKPGQVLAFDGACHGQLHYVRTEWWSGPFVAWNMGVALAQNDLCLLMGSDDYILPGCLDALRDAYTKNHEKPAWYNLTIELDDRTQHSVFNNAAAVTRKLWAWLGGFPPSASLGAGDAMLISILMVHGSEKLIQVREGVSLYHCRQGDHQDTLKQGALFSYETIRVRDIETSRWTSPKWGEHIL